MNLSQVEQEVGSRHLFEKRETRCESRENRNKKQESRTKSKEPRC
jgi:hypothetical protein